MLMPETTRSGQPVEELRERDVHAVGRRAVDREDAFARSAPAAADAAASARGRSRSPRHSARRRSPRRAAAAHRQARGCPRSDTPSSLVTRMRGMGSVSISRRAGSVAGFCDSNDTRTEARPAPAGNVFCKVFVPVRARPCFAASRPGFRVGLVLLLPERDCGIDGSCAPRGAEARNQRDEARIPVTASSTTGSKAPIP